MKRINPKQLTLTLRTWGGRREGAGRKPKGKKAGMPHRRRGRVTRHQPIHVTVRIERELRSLRGKAKMKSLRKAFKRCQRKDFRVTDWSVQHDHIHLVCEAHSARALSLGMRSFTGIVAKGLNALAVRTGRVFTDRYHAHVLKTPREVRCALAYVLNNARHHKLRLSPHHPDPCSSGAWFEGWRGTRRSSTAVPADEDEDPPIATPQSWLREVGWRKHGLIRLNEVPGCPRRLYSKA